MRNRRLVGIHGGKRRGIAWRTLAGAGILAGSLFVVEASSSPAHAVTPFLALGGTIQYNGNGAVGWSDSGVPAQTSSCQNNGVDIGTTYGLFNCGTLVGTQDNPFPVTSSDLPTYNSSLGAANGAYQSAFIIDQLNDSYTDCGAKSLSQGSNIFGGGDKFTDDPSADTHSLGNSDAKNEISNAYAVAAQNSADRQVYVGMERIVNNGDTHADFQFLHAAVSQTGTCSGGFTGVREQGDIALQVDFSQGGDNPSLALLVWSCDGMVPTTASEIGKACSAGPQSNAGWVTEQQCSGAAAPGCYEAGAVSIATNAKTAVPCGAWVCRTDQANQVTPVTSVDTNEFMEGSVNLDRLGFNFGCSATYWPVTRAAAGNGQSGNPDPGQTSQLKALAPPAGFQTCPGSKTEPCVSPPPEGSTTGYSDSATVTRDVGTGTPTGSVAFYACGPFETQPTSDPVCTPTSANAVSVSTEKTPTSTPGDATAIYTSQPFTPDQDGWYCFDAEYAPSADAHLLPSNDQSTQTRSECFQQQNLTPPAITATKSETPDNPVTGVAPGGTITYTITLSNSGQTQATGVNVTDQVPTDTTFVSADNGGTLGADGNVTWTNLTVPGSGTKTVSFTVTVNADAKQMEDIPNTAYVSSDFNQCDSDGPCATNTVDETVKYPVVQASKSQNPANGATVHRGDTITYGITLTNNGLVDATSVPVTDAVPAGTTFVSATNGGVLSSDKKTVTWNIADLTAGAWNAGTSTVTPGTPVTVSFTVTVNQNDTNNQVIPNVAQYPDINNPDPACKATCPTNQVTATVQVPATSPQTATTTTTTTTTTVKPAVQPAKTPGKLAFTGADITKTISGGVLMGLGGTVLVLLSRRRRPRD